MDLNLKSGGDWSEILSAGEILKNGAKGAAEPTWEELGMLFNVQFQIFKEKKQLANATLSHVKRDILLILAHPKHERMLSQIVHCNLQFVGEEKKEAFSIGFSSLKFLF